MTVNICYVFIKFITVLRELINKMLLHVTRCSYCLFIHYLALSGQEALFIRITCPCNTYPLIPHFYSKAGVCRGIPIFLIFALKHRLWVLVRVPLIYVLSKNKKNIKNLLLKMFLFHNLKNLCILIAWASFCNVIVPQIHIRKISKIYY